MKHLSKNWRLIIWWKTNSAFLFLKNLLLFKKLVVKTVNLRDKIIIQNNLIQIYWDTQGCHQITIKGIGKIPGSAKGLLMLFSSDHNPIEIYFHGVFSSHKISLPIDYYTIELTSHFYLEMGEAMIQPRLEKGHVFLIHNEAILYSDQIKPHMVKGAFSAIEI